MTEIMTKRTFLLRVSQHKPNIKTLQFALWNLGSFHLKLCVGCLGEVLPGNNFSLAINQSFDSTGTYFIVSSADSCSNVSLYQSVNVTVESGKWSHTHWISSWTYLNGKSKTFRFSFNYHDGADVDWFDYVDVFKNDDKHGRNFDLRNRSRMQ